MSNPQTIAQDTAVGELNLAEIEAMDDSVLGHALRRLTRSSSDERHGISSHNSTQHNSTQHNSTPW